MRTPISDRMWRPAGALARRMRALATSTQGIAAVEFAMVLPVMVLMYMGMTELTFGISNNRKLTLLSRTLADLTSRTPTMNQAEMDNTFNAASVVLAPFDPAMAKMVVSSVVVKAVPNSTAVEGRVCWSKAKGPDASARAANGIYPVPDGFKTAGTSFIVAEVNMDYLPMFGSAIIGTLVLGETTPWPVRGNQGTQVIFQGTPACPTA